VVYADNIEAPLARRWTPSQIFPRHSRDLAPLVPVYRCFRSFHVMRCARLNFYETKYICLPPNQIDLSTAPRGAEVARHHRVPQLPQMEVSILFPVPPVRWRSGIFSAGRMRSANQSRARMVAWVKRPASISVLMIC